MNEQAFSVLEKWLTIRHSGIVTIREAFTTRAFGDNCLYQLTIYVLLSHKFRSSRCCI